MRVHPWHAQAVALKINFDQAVFRYPRLRWLFSHRTLLRYHSPSLQNFRALAGSCRNENFCKSAYVSVSKPKMNIPVPVESRCVIVFGAFGCECRGELTIITGSETTNTHTAWYRKRKKTIEPRSIPAFVVSHLKRPKYGKSDDVLPVIFELLVSTYFHDSIQQICRQPCAPHTDEHRHHELSRVVVLRRKNFIASGRIRNKSDVDVKNC